MQQASFVRLIVLAGCLLTWPTLAQTPPESKAPDAPARPNRQARSGDWTPPGEAGPSKDELAETIRKSVEFLLERQEAFDKGGEKAEWPYEGVYRVRGDDGTQVIPIGYRVGGTGIVGHALIEAPGLKDDAKRLEALVRSMRFVVKSIAHPLMNPDYDGGYDVRGWGYTYGLLFLLRCEDEGIVPEDLKPEVRRASEFFVRAIQETQISEVGGWNYARQSGKGKVSPPSPFMTAPTLDALFEAKARGYEVSAEVVDKALKTLERSRTLSGSIVYSGFGEGKEARGGDRTPGAVGRMLASVATLHQAGRATPAEVRAALDAFIVNWGWLDQRRAQNGTHVGPYTIAPYYFYYAHRAAGKAIEMLPKDERAEYRRRVLQLLYTNRLEDGTWNDRVFPRSASFGTASAMLTILAPSMKAPAKWDAPKP